MFCSVISIVFSLVLYLLLFSLYVPLSSLQCSLGWVEWKYLITKKYIFDYNSLFSLIIKSLCNSDYKIFDYTNL